MHEKPAGRKNYGSIGHLPNSRMGVGDHHVHEGQARIATVSDKDKSGKRREIIVQEKLDGSNVGVFRKNGEIFALSRAGYPCGTSPFPQHHHFEKWVMRQRERWLELLNDGERLVGEWLMQAHGTRYALPHEPFVAFDLMVEDERTIFDVFQERFADKVVTPHLVHRGNAISVEAVLKELGDYGFHGALDKIEGAIWRVEMVQDPNNRKRAREVEFLCKYVRPDKVDGVFLDKEGQPPIFNWQP